MAKGSLPARQAWINQIFKAQSAGAGGVVRRSATDVRKYASHQDLKKEVLARGFHLIRTGDQYVILCYSGELRVIC